MGPGSREPEPSRTRAGAPRLLLPSRPNTRIPAPAAPGVSQSQPRVAQLPMPAQLDSPAKRLLDFQPPQLCQPQPPLRPCCPRVQDQRRAVGSGRLDSVWSRDSVNFSPWAQTPEKGEAWCCLPEAGPLQPSQSVDCPTYRCSAGATGLVPHCDRLTAHKQDKAQDPRPHPQALQGPTQEVPVTCISQANPRQTQTRTRLVSPPTLHVARMGQGTATPERALLLSRALDSHTAITTVSWCPLPAQRGRRDLPRAGCLWHCTLGLTPRPAPRQHQALGSKAQSQPKNQPRPEQGRPRLPRPLTTAL